MASSEVRVELDVNEHELGAKLSELEPEVVPRRGWFVRNLWLVAALCAFVLNGIANFLLGQATSHESAATPSGAGAARFPAGAMLLVASGSGLVAVPFLCGFAATRKTRSHFREQLRRPRAIVANVVASLCNYSAIISLGIAFALDPGGKGIVSSITAVNCLVVAVVARFAFNEQLAAVHYVGMAVCVAGVIVISAGSASSGSLSSFGFGMLAMLLFAVTTLFVKLSAKRFGSTAAMSSFVVIATQAVIGVTFCVVQAARGVPLQGALADSDVVLALSSGIVLRFATIALTIGVVQGLAGPTSAIALTNGALVLILDVTILGSVPSATKLVGMFVALAGVLVLTLAPQIAACVEKVTKSKSGASDFGDGFDDQDDGGGALHDRSADVPDGPKSAS
jgi:drug/metabolite transporter (DMT)-like permease